MFNILAVKEAAVVFTTLADSIAERASEIGQYTNDVEDADDEADSDCPEFEEFYTLRGFDGIFPPTNISVFEFIIYGHKCLALLFSIEMLIVEKDAK